MKNYLKGFACILAIMAGAQSMVTFATENDPVHQDTFIRILVGDNSKFKQDDETWYDKVQMIESIKKSDDDPPLDSPLI